VRKRRERERKKEKRKNEQAQKGCRGLKMRVFEALKIDESVWCTEDR